MARSNFSLSSSRDREIRQVDDHRSLSQAPWASCQKSRIAAMRSCTFIGNHFPPPSTARAYLCAPCLLQATPIALAPATALYGPAPARPAPWGRRARRSALPARPRSSPARPCRSPMPSPRPRSVADSFRALDQTRQRSPDAGAPDAGPGAPPARGACARESRAIPCMQLPRMRPRSDRGMSQGGRGSRLSPYCGSSWAVLWIAFHRGSRSR